MSDKETILINIVRVAIASSTSNHKDVISYGEKLIAQIYANENPDPKQLIPVLKAVSNIRLLAVRGSVFIPIMAL